MGNFDEYQWGISVSVIIRSWREIATQMPPVVEPGSELAKDGLASPKYQVAHSGWAGIMQAMDHLHAMQALITEAQMLHT